MSLPHIACTACGGEAIYQMVIGCPSHLAHDYRFCFTHADSARLASVYRHPECGTYIVPTDDERKARLL